MMTYVCVLIMRHRFGYNHGRFIRDVTVLMLSTRGGDPIAQHCCEVRENTTACWPIICEWNWVDGTLQKHEVTSPHIRVVGRTGLTQTIDNARLCALSQNL